MATLAVRDAPEEVVRSVPEPVRRDAPLGRARVVKHVAQRRAVAERPLLGREDPSGREPRMLRREHPDATPTDRATVRDSIEQDARVFSQRLVEDVAQVIDVDERMLDGFAGVGTK